MPVFARAVIGVCAAAAAVLAACSGDDDARRTAPQRMDLVNLVSDSSGTCRTMVLDSGDTLALSRELDGYDSDTVTRCMVVYVARNTTPRPTAVIYSMGEPVTTWIKNYATVRFDTVKVVAAWIGGGCINLRLKVDDYGGAHYFGFAWLGWSYNPDSTRVACMALYHSARSYSGFYNRDATVCCPLSQLLPTLRQGTDSVALLTNDAGTGPSWHRMPY